MSEHSATTPRKSLTKKQLEHPEALELLAILQSLTADGRLLDDEILSLEACLSDNASSALPAVECLRGSVEAVLEDGRVSAEERSWLQSVIETVLPREERDFARMRRREATATDREERRAARERERELARKTKPIARLDFMVAGTRHEGRGDVIRHHCKVGDQVALVRERENPHSPNATLIRLATGESIGYLPESEAVRIARLLDDGARQSAEIKKILAGRSAPIPVVWGELYQCEAPIGQSVPREVYARSLRRSASEPAAESPTSKGTWLWFFLGLLIIVLLVLIL